MKIERLIELLSHPDADWRRQGRELMRALGEDACAQILRRSLRSTWLWPIADGDPTELVAALAECAELHEARSVVRELPPIATTDVRDIVGIARGFPNATLRLIWERSPDSIEFLADLPCEKLQLSVGTWTAEPPIFSPSLRRLVFFGAIPELDAPGLRELEVASWSSAWFETTFEQLAPQLERLHVLNQSGELPHDLPRLRELRLPSLPPRLRVDTPLERVHVTQTSGRELLEHPAVGPRTRIRVDDWTQPEPSLEGDARIVWLGAKRQGWADLLPTLPNLEVAEVDDPTRLPRDVLPTPWMIAESRNSDAWPRAAIDAWARRGRSWGLRSRTHTQRKILAIKRVRSFSAWGLAHAKRFFEAIDEDRLVALTPHEALYWQAVLRDAGMELSLVEHES